MICKNCGAELKTGVRFCPKCGTQNDNVPVQKNGNEKILYKVNYYYPGILVQIILFAVLTIFIWGESFYMLNKYANRRTDLSEFEIFFFVIACIFILALTCISIASAIALKSYHIFIYENHIEGMAVSDTTTAILTKKPIKLTYEQIEDVQETGRYKILIVTRGISYKCTIVNIEDKQAFYNIVNEKRKEFKN